jgi:hypothetical protein
VIKVRVGTGEKKQTFVCYEDLLRQSSVFFDNALKPEWKEAQDRVITLAETCPESFRAYAKFLLTGLLFIHPNRDFQDQKEQPLIMSDATVCCNLLELAGFLQAPDFRDAIADALIESIADATGLGYKVLLSSGLVNRIYELSPVGLPFRNLLVDIFLREYDDAAEGYFLQIKEGCPEFLHDFIKAAAPYFTSLKSAKDMPSPLNLSKSCKYHEHTLRGQSCYKIKFWYLAKKTGVTAGKSIISRLLMNPDQLHTDQAT